MILGIMAAMEQELKHLCDAMENSKKTEIAGRVFYTGILNGIETVAVWSKWGKVSASATTTLLISKFNATSLIFIGVAGAIEPSLNVGDIVISTSLYQHDMDARPLMSRYEIPLYGKVFFESDKELNECAYKSSETVLKSITDHIDQALLDEFNIKDPKSTNGLIASGDKFVSTEEHIANLHPDEITHAVEMEGAAFAQICHDFNVPCVVIRTISDNANHTAHIDFGKFIENIASRYSLAIITEMTKTPLLQALISPEPEKSLPHSCSDVITLLGLEKHIEGGYYKETHRSTQEVTVKRDGIDSIESSGTSIQFLLNKDEGGFSAWHRIEDDETWYYQGGEPMLVHYFSQDGSLITTLLGDPLKHSGSTNQFTVPRNHWFSAEVGADNGFSLVACSVSPAFDFKRFKLANRDVMLQEFPEHTEIITRLSIASPEKKTKLGSTDMFKSKAQYPEDPKKVAASEVAALSNT